MGLAVDQSAEPMGTAPPAAKEQGASWRRGARLLRRGRAAGSSGSYPAMVVASLPAIPLLAAAVSVMAYCAGLTFTTEGRVWRLQFHAAGSYLWVHNHALWIGTLVALAVLLAGPLLSRRWATAQTANAFMWGSLTDRICRLRTQLEALEKAHPELAAHDGEPVGLGPPQVALPHPIAQGVVYHECQLYAYGEAKGCLARLEAEAQEPGLRWVLGTGYIQLWHILHHGEEALIQIQPREAVVTGALWDLARLKGSTLDDGDHLSQKLLQALLRLYPSEYIGDLLVPALSSLLPVAAAPQCLSGTSPCDEHARTDRSRRHADGAHHPSDERANHLTPGEEMIVRSIIRGLRCTIDTFRDDRYTGIVRARNRLMNTVIAIGITVFMLVAHALSIGTPAVIVGEMAVYYWVGAAAGLFNRLYLDTKTNLGVEDYGLFTARLIHTPLLSGLAAVSGILVTAMVDISGAPHPSSDYYGFSPQNFIAAFLFGLAPGLLISRLQQQTEQYKQDLKSSEPTQRTAA